MPNIKTKRIGGLNISILNSDDIIALVARAVQNKNGKQLTIAYVNQHTLVFSYKIPQFKKSLDRIEILHIDGIGMRMALRFLHHENLSGDKITGTDLYYKILSAANREKAKLFICGATPEIVGQCASVITKKYPEIKIVGSIHGYFNLDDQIPLNLTQNARPDILFLGLGIPKQELWLEKYGPQIDAKVIVLVGGGLTFISGMIKRAPMIMRKSGLEWLYRLYNEPKRLWKRYFFGIPFFICLIIAEKVRLIRSDKW